MSEAVERISALAAQGEDVWNVAVSAAQEAQIDMDSGRWVIGDLACLVQKKYGQNRIAEFAKAINVGVDRVREYRTVCRFWTFSVRTEYQDSPVLVYSHFKQAARLKDLTRACEFLERCAAQAYTIEQARIEVSEMLGTPTPPRKIVDVVARVVKARDCEATFLFEADLVAALKPYPEVRLIAYEVKNEH